jgi:hypothetical protein
MLPGAFITDLPARHHFGDAGSEFQARWPPYGDRNNVKRP